MYYQLILFMSYYYIFYFWYALLCITFIERIAYLLTRLPFGTTPVSDGYCIISESITDLSQAIANDISWNPHQTESDQIECIPGSSIPKQDPILKIKPFPLLVPVIPNQIYVDDYIDDILTVTYSIQPLIERAKKGVPLALHTSLDKSQIESQ